MFVELPKIGNAWDDILAPVFAKEEFRELWSFLNVQYQNATVFPPKEKIFTALQVTPPERVKVILLGQDPYIRPGQAQGMAFSVPPEEPLPHSLQNIFKEMQTDIGKHPQNGCLLPWALQGVLLLNSVLTVDEGLSNSHQGKGWESVTDHIFQYLASSSEPKVYVLWGNSARAKATMIHSPIHLVIQGVHPSPLSAHRGFFGSRPFSQINAFLKKNSLQEIRFC
jgi:uracil-DNA glycosylase